MLRTAMLALAYVMASAVGAGCDANPFDRAQVPIVSVEVAPGAPPVFSWTPEGAAIVRVFRGPSAGDGYTPAFVWEVGLGPGAGENGLRSPLVYGVEPPEGVEPFPAPPLVAGEPYTVWVFRDDPEGSGTGFSNTNNTYTGTATFVP